MHHVNEALSPTLKRRKLKTTATECHVVPAEACRDTRDGGEYISEPFPHILCPPRCQPQKCNPAPLKWVSHWPGAHLLGKTGWPVSPRDHPPVSTSPALGLQMLAPHPAFFYVGSGTEILKLYYLLSPSKHLFNKRQIVGWWQLAFRDPPALDSMSLPTQCKLVCMRWGGTCGKERKVGPVATGTSPESGLSRAFTPQGSQPFPDASLKWIWNPKPFSKCPEVQPSETKDNKGLFKPLTFEG